MTTDANESDGTGIGRLESSLLLALGLGFAVLGAAQWFDIVAYRPSPLGSFAAALLFLAYGVSLNRRS